MGAGGILAIALALVVAQGPKAEAKKRRPPPHAGTTTEKSVAPPPRNDGPAASRRAEPPVTYVPPADGAQAAAAAVPNSDVPAATPTRTAKTRTYTFGAMDVEGKLKTPQLLYFLNRVKLELEMSAPDHRSFMKELEKTADDPNL